MPGEYLVLSRTGTNPLTLAVQSAIEQGFVPIGGVSVHVETRGREQITTFHQAMYKPG